MLEVSYQSPFSCDDDSLPESDDDDDPAFDPSYPSRRTDGSTGSGNIASREEDNMFWILLDIYKEIKKHFLYVLQSYLLRPEKVYFLFEI